ncbi:MAG: PDZ domain-containing protein [Candidatus Cloacimonadaceae bacterium]
MKQTVILIIALVTCLTPVLLSAQEEIVLEKGEKRIIITGDNDLSDDLAELKKLKINMTTMTKDEAPDAPFFGIYPADLDFPKAQALNYPNSYGVLITGVVPNSPAYEYRLAEDDIIMEMDGKKVMNLKELDKLKTLYRAEDKVTLKIFRNGEIKDIEFVFGSRVKPQIPGTPEEKTQPTKKKLSTGDGGASWVPMYFNTEMEDVNELITAIGFSKLPEDGVLTHGFAFNGNIGSGWLLGGQFQFYGDSKKVNVDEDYINNMKYNMFIGGATIDKRFALTKNLITSLGVMIGGGSHKVSLIHTNGDYNWPEPEGTTTDIMGNNSNTTMSKGYILVQPRAEILLRLMSWFGLRAEGGFLYGYGPTGGWKIKNEEGESYELKNSPDTPFQGYTISIGPWFGF